MDKETEEIEYGQDLRQARAQKENTDVETEEIPQETQDELAAAANNKNKSVVFVLSILFKTISDLLDWFGLSFPIVGDALDIATGAISIFAYLSLSGAARKRGIIRSVGALLFELLPFGINDLIPTYVIEGIWTRFTTIKLANQAEEHLERMKEKK